MNNIFITDSYKKRKNAHARTHAQNKITSVCYVQKKKHALTDLSEHALWLVARAILEGLNYILKHVGWHFMRRK